MKLVKWSTNVFAVALVAGVAIAVQSGDVNASYSNGVAQAGDLATNSSSSYICSAGPVVGDIIFTAAHCKQVSQVDGVGLKNSTENETRDVRWSKVNGQISNAISTPGGDIPVAGVLEPWPGMKVWNSGQTTGVTGPGTNAGRMEDDPGMNMLIQDLKVCRGDSGGVAYTTIGGKNFLVGMVTRGNGSEYKDGTRAPNGQCADPTKGEPEAPPYYAGIQDMTVMCGLAGLTACVNEAGRPIGKISDVATKPGKIVVTGWAFDPSDSLNPMKARVSIDGRRVADVPTGIDRADVRKTWSTYAKAGFSGTFTASPGRHNVCVVLRNVGAGVDVDLGCRKVTVVTADPAATGMDDPGQLDFNGDGKTDVFSLGSRDAKGLYPWRVSYAGSSRWTTLGKAGVPLEGLRFGDFNGDGKTDIFSLGKRDARGLYQWRVSYGGTSRWKNLGKAGAPLEQLRFADFDGDGKTDIFSLGPRDAKKLYQWRVSYGGTSRWENLGKAGTPLEQLRFGDFNGDGKADIFSLGSRDAKKLYPWRVSYGGTSRWQNLGRAGVALKDLRFGDFNADGKTDIFSLGKRQANKQYPWRVSYGGTSRWKTLGSAGTQLPSMRFADFNGDGKTDIFSLGSRESNKLYPWRVSSGATSGWKKVNSAGAPVYDLRLR